jgi:hypothetical protein
MKPKIKRLRTKVRCWWIRTNLISWIPWRMSVVCWNRTGTLAFRSYKDAYEEMLNIMSEYHGAEVKIKREWHIPAKLQEFQGW